MPTSLSEIYDLSLMQITDYRLTDLFNTSVLDFENFMEAWLKYAIFDFNVCDQSLNYDSTTKLFDVNLYTYNQVVLANLIVKYWLQKVVNDITQMNLHITDRDFKVASEAANLREKTARLNTVIETCSQMLIDYGYRKKVTWSDWYAGNFEEGVT